MINSQYDQQHAFRNQISWDTNPMGQKNGIGSKRIRSILLCQKDFHKTNIAGSYMPELWLKCYVAVHVYCNHLCVCEYVSSM